MAISEKQQEALDAVQEHGSQRAAARALGIGLSTIQERLTRASKPAQAKMEALGYNAFTDTRTDKDAWDGHTEAFERKIAQSFKPTPQVKRSGAFAIFHSTDEHVDDDGAPLRLIEADIRAAHDMNAIMCHGGDLLNNWPLAGKLAKQWSEQNCTLPDALRRGRHFVELFDPDVWIDGNHEEMNPYLMQMIDGWLPKSTIRDYWSVRFDVVVPSGRPCRVAMSHKFQKGSSWFHGLQGHIREVMQGEPVDLYMDGHYHSEGVMDYAMPERGHSALFIASAGYKIVDKYATRISRGGKVPKIRGRAHWIVCDPSADEDAQMLTAFKDPRQAEAYLNGLQNLRAA